MSGRIPSPTHLSHNPRTPSNQEKTPITNHDHLWGANSATNTIKRLNNDNAVKAITWWEESGTIQLVTAVTLGGVYALHNIIDAQEKELTIFWAHDLTAMLPWMRST